VSKELSIGAVSSDVVRVRRRVLRRWFDGHARDLPWRATRDPWHVLLAEVMLQQTQVPRALERWPLLCEEFPTPESMAEAGQAAVVRTWAGLGYNRRASALHRCAVQLVDRHGGVVPDDLHALLALDGIGPYTARAVLAFAFERDVAVLDTNVGRVLARWEGRPLTHAEAQLLADAHVPRGGGWWWNQAMLDLGAAVCVRRAPDCAACPMRRTCAFAATAGASTGVGVPDPAEGSAGVGRGQSRFDGSDRQGRGRLLDAVRTGAVRAAPSAIAAAAGWPDDEGRAQRIAAGLERDGLVERRRGWLHLAGEC
jgi:A/G-specific adenine glycosylase